MALPVINQCFRVTWEFAEHAGVTPRIVQNYLTASDDIQQLGEALWEEAPDGLFMPMHENYEPQSLAILPLDGIHATVIVPRPSGVTTQFCLGSGDVILQACALMSFRTNIRGSRGRGRSYIGPITEGAQLDGTIVGTSADELAVNWRAYAAALSLMDPAIALAVASYKHAEATPVATFSLDTVVATQRRRLAQIRS